MNWILAAVGSAADHGHWWPDSWLGRVWIVFGLCAQAVFASRFLVQWVASERRGRSYIPVVFWYLSLLGGVMLFAYAAVWKKDVVFTIGQATGCFVYIRNLMLLHREKALF